MALIARRMEKRKAKRLRLSKTGSKVLPLNPRQALPIVVCTPPRRPGGEGHHRCQALLDAGSPFLEWQPAYGVPGGKGRGFLILVLGVNDPAFSIDDYDLLWSWCVSAPDGFADGLSECGPQPDRSVVLNWIRSRDLLRAATVLSLFRRDRARGGQQTTDRSLSSLTFQAFANRVRARREIAQAVAQASSSVR